MIAIRLALCSVLLFPLAAGSQPRNFWQELEQSLKSGQPSQIEAAARNAIANEGLELRTLLSILHSNRISLSGNEAAAVIAGYNKSKRSFFRNRAHVFQIDSLYSQAYMLHQNRNMIAGGTLKTYEKASLIPFNERVINSYKNDRRSFNYYDYLKIWIQQPGKPEDEVIADFLRQHGVTVDGLLSYAQLDSVLPSSRPPAGQFDLAAQRLLTHFREKAKETEDSGQIDVSLDYVDSIAARFPDLHANDFNLARRLAMRHRMDSRYLQLLTDAMAGRVTVHYYMDTLPTYGRTADDTAYVKRVLRSHAGEIRQAAGQTLPILNYDLYLLSNRFMMLHDFGSNISYPRSGIAYFTTDRGRKQNLFLEYVYESIDLFPYAIAVLLRSGKDWNFEINANLTYVQLHLFQYNANGQRSDDRIFALFRRISDRLVRLGINDLEDYYCAEDYYTTAVKHQPSNYGWRMGRGNFSGRLEINDRTAENRRKNFLLPFGSMRR